jgi:hypothetical protein
MLATEQIKSLNAEVNLYNKKIKDLNVKIHDLTKQAILEDPIWKKTTWEFNGFDFSCITFQKEMYECLDKKSSLSIDENITIQHYHYYDDTDTPYDIRTFSLNTDIINTFIISREFLMKQGSKIIIPKESIVNLKSHCELILQLIKELK